MSVPETVLVLTEPFDPTADLVIAELNSRGVPVFRADAADFPRTLSIEARLVDGRWAGSLRNERRHVAFEEIGAVWYRRPSRFRFPGLTAFERRFAAAQARAGFGGVLASLPCTWVNHPHAIGRAEYKAAQLPAAAACGLTVPDTLITSIPEAQLRFARTQASGVISKPLSGAAAFVSDDTAHFAYTHVVPAEEWGDEHIAHTAHLFQAWAPKDYEVRLVAVGQRLFPVAIHTDSAQGRIDWRSDYASHTYATVEVPGAVRRGVARLMEHFGLTYAAVDFIVSGSRWTFLEVNPNGQWAWLEQALGIPITQALADLLDQGPLHA